MLLTIAVAFLQRIGCLFFRSSDPAASARWYDKHLGIDAGGEGESGVRQQAAGPTVFAPFASDTGYFPERNSWMLNLRVATSTRWLRNSAMPG